MTNPNIPLAGVVGWPIAHSKSPRIHSHWLERHKIQGHYVPLAIAPDDFEAAMEQLPKMGFVGVNVTIPHKKRALKLGTQTTQRARAIGAANTLTFLNKGGFLADNTDAAGFFDNLTQNAPQWCADAGPALVLGAGGSSRAVLWALLQAGVPGIILANRTREHAENLATEFAAKFKAQIQVINWLDISNATASVSTVVNTTSLGMDQQPPLEITLTCKPQTLVTDIVYTPLKTALLDQAERKGLPTVDGLGMLLHQAVPGFEQWFGTRPVVDATLRDVAGL